MFGTSSYKMYRKVLLMGCRCVEIDVWDNLSLLDGDEPVVTHAFRSRLARDEGHPVVESH